MKKKYASRYINFPFNDMLKLKSRYYAKCPTCNRITASLDYESDELTKCKHCGGEMKITEKYIIPSLGFSTEHEEIKSTILKPKKTFSSPTYYLGGGHSNNDIDSFGEVLSIESTRNDELITLNENPFYVCPQCGYTKIIKENKSLHFRKISIEKKQHSKRYNMNILCSNKSLTRTHLAHVFSTDVVKITINEYYDDEEALSFLYAFLDGISLAFNIERNDINGVYNYEKNNTQFVIFDQVPGGAGHVKRIMTKEYILEALNSALTIVDKHCCEEDSSCYDCLRNYRNQAVHEKLRRGKAKNKIQSIIEKIETYRFDTAQQKTHDIEEITPLVDIKVCSLGTAFMNKNLDEIVKYSFEDHFEETHLGKLKEFLMTFQTLPTHFGTELLIDGKRTVIADLFWREHNRALLINQSDNDAVYLSLNKSDIRFINYSLESKKER